MSLAKDKYREETNEDCYCEAHQVEGGSYKDEYVLWLEQQVNTLILPAVLDEIIGYIEQADQEGEWERGNCRSLQQVIDAKDMPYFYYKLIELRNGR